MSYQALGLDYGQKAGLWFNLYVFFAYEQRSEPTVELIGNNECVVDNTDQSQGCVILSMQCECSKDLVVQSDLQWRDFL